jgi:aspartate kinase
VPDEALQEAMPICEAVVAELEGDRVDVQRGLSRVALVGSGMHNQPGVYARAFEVLMEAGIEVIAVSASSISIAFLVGAEHEDATLQVLHSAFTLGGDAS